MRSSTAALILAFCLLGALGQEDGPAPPADPNAGEADRLVATLTQDLAAERTKSSTLEAQLAAKEAALTEAKAAQQQGAVTAAQLKSANEKIVEQTVEIQKLGRDSEELDKKSKAADKQAQADSTAAQAKLTAAQAQVKDMETKQTALGKKRDSLDVELVKAREEKSRDDASRAAEKMAFEEQLKSWREQHEALRGVYSDLRQRYDDPTMQDFLGKRAVKIYSNNPGMGGAYNKTFTYIVPGLSHSRERGSSMLNQTQLAIQMRLNPYISENTIPVVSGFLVYGMLFIPLFLSFWCLASVHAVMKLRPMLMFCHLYFFLSSLLASIAAYMLEIDPMTVFQQEYSGLYLFLQGSVALGYITYVCLQMAAFAQSRNNTEWFVRLAQLAGIIVIGSLYYELVWTPAMLDKPPVPIFNGTFPAPWSLMLPYFLPCTLFAVIMRMEQLSRASRDQAAIDEDTIHISVEVHGDLDETDGKAGSGEKEA